VLGVFGFGCALVYADTDEIINELQLDTIISSLLRFWSSIIRLGFGII